MTRREAEAGIGQRVTDTESGREGTLRAVEEVQSTGGVYFVGLVDFHTGSVRIWLKRLKWADVLETPHTYYWGGH